MDIKQSDLIRFWTWCGFKLSPTIFHYEMGKRTPSYISPSGEITNRWAYNKGRLPELTLDNIFEYTVPKLGIVTMTNGFKGWTVTINLGYGEIPHYLGEADNPTEALYKAIMEVIKNENTK